MLHGGRAKAVIDGFELWLEHKQAVSIQDQIAAATHGGVGQASDAASTQRSRDVIYQRRRRGRLAAIAAVESLRLRRKIDDLTQASLYRFLGASLADREKSASSA